MQPDKVGIVVSTLMTDPMMCSATDALAASKAASESGIGTFAMWPRHIAAPSGPDPAMVEAWTGRVAVLETAFGFARGLSDRCVNQTLQLVDLASRVKASMLAVCTLRSSLESVANAVDGLRHLANAANEQGISVGLEFIPWSGVPDLSTAWRLISEVDAANLGVVIDTWHWHRQPGGPAHEVLESIPGNRIAYVQICDAAAEPQPDLMREAMSARLLPGKGVVDFGALGRSLEQIGANPLFMTEIYSDALASRGARQMADAIQTSIAALDFGCGAT